MARAANAVWNFCNDTQKSALRWGKKWPTAFDLQRLTAGSSKELGLSASSIEGVCNQYAASRQRRRPWLRYRGKRSLGWIPFRAEGIRQDGEAFIYYGRRYPVWLSRSLPKNGKLKDGCSFAQDSRGRWYINLVVEVPEVAARDGLSVGVDLGLSDLATLSDGSVIENPRHFASLESKLAIAQQARKKRLARCLHAKIEARRRDYLHKASTALVKRYGRIVVGNISVAGLAKTSMAKSLHDASWTTFRSLLRYKAIAHGVRYEEVSERFTTQTCSACGSIAGPKGYAGLGIRQWVCGDCGASHDRDVNAAINILARSGHRAPAEGALASHGEEVPTLSVRKQDRLSQDQPTAGQF